MPSNTKENGFETLIVEYLINNNGYEQGDTNEYNKEYAIDEDRFVPIPVVYAEKAWMNFTFWIVIWKKNVF